jgi:YVTN family beta-propeller protein
VTDVLIGDEFLGYRIEAQIGRGGMGVVYRAFDLRLKRAVALKFIAPDLALDERFRDRFLRESELAASLEHPNVVPIHGAGEIDGRLYLAMRHVEGTDLRALLWAEGALSPARAVAICRQIAGAVDAAHARGLVHRDLKPSNVLLDRDEHVYLADFGLTRRSAEPGMQPLDGRSLGTPAYLAPEQFQGDAVDGRADVYSLGCLLFECLTGEPPFRRGSVLAVAWAHLEDEPPSAKERNRDLTDGIDPVLRRAMAKRPDERYPTCAALVAAAEHALGLRSVPLLRRRSALLLGLGIAAAVATIAAVLATRGGGTPAASVARENSVVRIDPATNAVDAVIDVGLRPAGIAVAGGRVWIYNSGESSVSEIDAATNEVRRTTWVLPVIDRGAGAGPVIAADAEGAWLIGGTARPVLTRLLPGGRKREYRLGTDPRPGAVAVRDGTVWILTGGFRENHLLRFDPARGRVVGTTLLPGSPSIDGLAVGLGAVWVFDSARAVLYRVDARSGVRSGSVDLGRSAPRPVLASGGVWVHVSDLGGTAKLVDPRTLATVVAFPSVPPARGYYAVGYGSIWWYDVPTGTVARFHLRPMSVVDTIRVADAPFLNGVCLTSIAAGAGAVWVTVADMPTAVTCP